MSEPGVAGAASLARAAAPATAGGPAILQTEGWMPEGRWREDAGRHVEEGRR